MTSALTHPGVVRADGGVAVTVSATPGGFAVADDGPDFPDGDVERAFEAGYTASADGTGLGLTIVRELAEAYGWTVEAGDAPGGGARVAFSGAVRGARGDSVSGS